MSDHVCQECHEGPLHNAQQANDPSCARCHQEHRGRPLLAKVAELNASLAVVCAFFLMLAGYQWMTAGGSVRAAESAKSSIYHALIGFTIVILCKVLANLVAGALGAPAAA